MSATINLHDILSKLKELDKEEQFTLLEKLVALIRKHEVTNNSTKLSQISGVGSKVWKEINIDDYINEERQW